MDSNMENEDANDLIKSILKTVKESCTIEATREETIVPLSCQLARISFYTGLSCDVVDKLLSEPPRISMLSLENRILILETVKSLYKQNRAHLNFLTIFEQVTKNKKWKTTDKKFSLEAFIKEMEIFGYQWKETVDNTKIIIEDPELRFERYIYLNKIKKIRADSSQWQQIVYVDERLINDTQRYQKLWITEPSSKAMANFDESVFYHAVSNTGFVTGMFTNQNSESDFNKWFTDMLLTHLKPQSVIIMDNNPLHGSLENVCNVTRYHTKSDMVRWLTNNNTPCSFNMSKPSLFELIKKSNEEQKVYKLDQIIRSHGHIVLRLPRKFHDLSMTTPLWDNIIKNGCIGDTSTVMQLQNQLMKVINNTALTVWSEYEKYIEDLEEEMLEIAMEMEEHSDNYEFK